MSDPLLGQKGIDPITGKPYADQPAPYGDTSFARGALESFTHGSLVGRGAFALGLATHIPEGNYPPDPNYDVFADPSKFEGVPAHNFVGVRSDAERQDVIRRYRIYEGANRDLAENTTFMQNVVGGFIDPVNWYPASFGKELSFFRRIADSAATNAATTLLTEPARIAGDPTEDASHIPMSVASSALMGAALHPVIETGIRAGAFAYAKVEPKLMSALNVKRAADRLDTSLRNSETGEDILKDDHFEQKPFTTADQRGPWKSSALRAAENLKQESGTFEQMLNMIRNTPGVSKDALEWSELETAFGPKDKVTKQQIVDFLSSKDRGWVVEQVINDTWNDNYSLRGNRDRPSVLLLRWQVPKSLENFIWVGGHFRTGDEHPTRDSLMSHARFDVRQTEDGKSVLTVLEIQSDLHGEAQRRPRGTPEGTPPVGYKTSEDVRAAETHGMALLDLVAEARSAIRQGLRDYMKRPLSARLIEEVQGAFGFGDGTKGLLRLMDELLDRLNRTTPMFTKTELKNISSWMAELDGYLGKNFGDRAEAIRNALLENNYYKQAIEGRNPVVDTPFKKTWDEMTVRRLIKWAADNGHDYIVFPKTAEQVAEIERYGKLVQLESGKWIAPTGDNRTTIVERMITQVPRYLKKLAKQFGATVEDVNLPYQEGRDISYPLHGHPDVGITMRLDNPRLVTVSGDLTPDGKPITYVVNQERGNGEGYSDIHTNVMQYLVSKVFKPFGKKVEKLFDIDKNSWKYRMLRNFYSKAAPEAQQPAWHAQDPSNGLDPNREIFKVGDQYFLDQGEAEHLAAQANRQVERVRAGDEKLTQLYKVKESWTEEVETEDEPGQYHDQQMDRVTIYGTMDAANEAIARGQEADQAAAMEDGFPWDPSHFSVETVLIPQDQLGNLRWDHNSYEAAYFRNKGKEAWLGYVKRYTVIDRANGSILGYDSINDAYNAMKEAKDGHLIINRHQVAHSINSLPGPVGEQIHIRPFLLSKQTPEWAGASTYYKHAGMSSELAPEQFLAFANHVYSTAKDLPFPARGAYSLDSLGALPMRVEPPKMAKYVMNGIKITPEMGSIPLLFERDLFRDVVDLAGDSAYRRANKMMGESYRLIDAEDRQRIAAKLWRDKEITTIASAKAMVAEAINWIKVQQDTPQGKQVLLRFFGRGADSILDQMLVVKDVLEVIPPTWLEGARFRIHSAGEIRTAKGDKLGPNATGGYQPLLFGDLIEISQQFVGKNQMAFTLAHEVGHRAALRFVTDQITQRLERDWEKAIEKNKQLDQHQQQHLRENKLLGFDKEGNYTYALDLEEYKANRMAMSIMELVAERNNLKEQIEKGGLNAQVLRLLLDARVLSMRLAAKAGVEDWYSSVLFRDWLTGYIYAARHLPEFANRPDPYSQANQEKISEMIRKSKGLAQKEADEFIKILTQMATQVSIKATAGTTIETDPTVVLKDEDASRINEMANRLVETGTGMEKLRSLTMPYYMLKNNAFEGAFGDRLARLADEIGGAPGLRMRGGSDGTGQALGVPAYAAQWSVRMLDAQQMERDFFAQMRMKDTGVSGFGQRLQSIKEFAGEKSNQLLGKMGKDPVFEGYTGMSYTDFRKEVGLALASGDKSDNIFAERAAKAIRNQFFEPARMAGQELDMFGNTALRRNLESAETTLELRRERYKFWSNIALKRAQEQNWGVVRVLQNILETMKQEGERDKVQIAYIKERMQQNRERKMETGKSYGDESYLHRIYVIGEILNRRDEWAALLHKHLGPETNVEEITAAIIEREQRNGIADLPDHESRSRPTPTMERELRLPTKELARAGFIETDSDVIMRRYLEKMGPAIEMTRKFGDPNLTELFLRLDQEFDMAMNNAALEALEKGDEKKFNSLVNGFAEYDLQRQALARLRDVTLNKRVTEDDPTAVSTRALNTAKAYAATALLGSTIYAAVRDSARLTYFGPARVFGTLFDAAIGSNRIELSAAMKEAMHTATELALASRMRGIMDMQHVNIIGETKIEKGGKFLASQMHFLNLVGVFTDTIKPFAGAFIQSDAIKAALDVRAGKATPAQIRDLAAMGIGTQDAKSIADQWEAAGSQKGNHFYLANTNEWSDARLVNMFRAGIWEQVNKIIPTPGASDRPVFMDNAVWGTILQLKGFSISATQRVAMSALQERDKRAAVTIGSMLMMGFLSDYLTAPDYDDRKIYSPDRLMRAIELSGVTGILSDFNQMIETASANQAGIRPFLGIDPPHVLRDPNWGERAGAVFGPATSLAGELVWAFTSTDATGNDQARALKRILPLNNLWLWNNQARRIQQSLGGMIEEIN